MTAVDGLLQNVEFPFAGAAILMRGAVDFNSRPVYS